jgi:two-component system copper resistance phosphate regulon response regulator CusR
VLLDIMMPGETGWEVLARIRARAGVPVIFVSARESVEERVRGLRLGADDYIVKPFAFAELLARMDAVMRRRRHLPTLRASDLHIDLIQRRVEYRGSPIDLSPREFDVLRVLVEAKDRIVSRRELLR